MNDYAGQRELIAENMMINICIELTKYLQELKQERKMVRENDKGRQRNWARLKIKQAVGQRAREGRREGDCGYEGEAVENMSRSVLVGVEVYYFFFDWCRTVRGMLS